MVLLDPRVMYSIYSTDMEKEILEAMPRWHPTLQTSSFAYVLFAKYYAGATGSSTPLVDTSDVSLTAGSGAGSAGSASAAGSAGSAAAALASAGAAPSAGCADAACLGCSGLGLRCSSEPVSLYAN